jgi:hypothetical protein
MLYFYCFIRILKLQQLNEIIQNLNYKSKYIRNFIPQTENSKNYIKKLKEITFSVWSKFDEVKGKYSDLINDATRRIDNQIKINTCMNKYYNLKLNNDLGLYLDQELDGKKSNDENANINKMGPSHISMYTPNSQLTKNSIDSEKIVTERIKLDIENLKDTKQELQDIIK